MKVSLIVPTWNATLYLENLFTVLQEQTYPVYQVVVVDDMSDPPYATEQEELCKRHGATYVYHSAEFKTKRRAECNQVGLEYVDGDIVGFFCVDLLFYPDYLEKLMGVIRKYENIVLFHRSRGLPYYELGTKIPIVRRVIELMHSGEIDKHTRTDDESQFFTFEEKWWSTLDCIHPTLYAHGCDGNALLRTRYAKNVELWDKNYIGHGSHCTDFAYNCLIGSLSCVVLKDVCALSVDHDKPPVIQIGTVESMEYFQKKWGAYLIPPRVKLLEAEI